MPPIKKVEYAVVGSFMPGVARSGTGRILGTFTSEGDAVEFIRNKAAAINAFLCEVHREYIEKHDANRLIYHYRDIISYRGGDTSLTRFEIDMRSSRYFTVVPIMVSDGLPIQYEGPRGAWIATEHEEEESVVIYTWTESEAQKIGEAFFTYIESPASLTVERYSRLNTDDGCCPQCGDELSRLRSESIC